MSPVDTAVSRDSYRHAPLSESVARLHEENGNYDLAAISRLTPEQAVNALCYLHGWDRSLLVRVLRQGAQVEFPAEDTRPDTEQTS